MKISSVIVTALLCLNNIVTPLNAQKSSNPLLEASYWEKKPDLNTVKADIAKGNSPSEMNANAFDAVVTAILNGGTDDVIVYLMDQKGNDINKITHDGRTYIFWAAYKGKLDIMKYAFSKGAKIDLLDSHGYSPFNFTALGGEKNTAVYDLLISKGAAPKTEKNHDGANALLLAISNDNELKITEYLQSKGLDLNSTDNNGANAIDYASRTGNIEVIKKLMAKGLKPTENAMVMAAAGTRRSSNGIEFFKYLESIGVKPYATDKEGHNALHFLARKPSQLETIKYFIEKGANVNQPDNDGNTPFMNAAASTTDLPTVEFLVPLVKDINASNKAGITPIAYAVKGNSTDVVALLISKGAKTDIKDAKGNDLLYYLIDSYNPSKSQNFDSKFELLKKNGISASSVQKDGNTAFHLAVAKENTELLKKIASSASDVNAKNKDGLTALHKAAMISKDDELLKYLLSLNAKKDIRTEFNETAYDLAKENKYLSTNKISVEFLK